MDNYNFIQQGWQCPICKRVYSPFTPCCFNCGGENVTWTGAIDWVKHESVTEAGTLDIGGRTNANIDCMEEDAKLASIPYTVATDKQEAENETSN